MRDAKIVASTLFLAMALAACGAWKSYRLPLDAYKAHDTFAPIAAVAGQEGLQAIEHPDSINVQYDDATWIQFMVQNDQYNMVILVDDKKVPPAELDKRFADAKAKGDEIWEKALATMGKTNAAMGGGDSSVTVNVTVNNPPPGLSGECQKLFNCYAQLSTDLCAAGDSGCKASFEFKIEGDDQTGCHEALAAVPATVQAMSMAKPGYATPATCL